MDSVFNKTLEQRTNNPENSFVYFIDVLIHFKTKNICNFVYEFVLLKLYMVDVNS